MSIGDNNTIEKLTVTSSPQPKSVLEDVINLWKKNRSTLGLFPRGAFEEYAERGWIIYLIKESKAVGYLLFREAKSRVVISHLCICKSQRGKGAARKLFNELKDNMNDGFCKGIEVRCRSDYETNRMWPKLGFEYIKNLRGKAITGSELTLWYYKYDVQDLLDGLGPKDDESDQAWAVLDSNIVFKLSEERNKENEEAHALLSEPTNSYGRYFVTPEIFVETERKSDLQEKEYSNSYAKKFERLEVKTKVLEKYQKLLFPIWGTIDTDRDRSDLNHVAYTAASGVQAFITLDTGLLEKAPAIYETCNVSIYRPVEFITNIDQAENHNKYMPACLSRTDYSSRCPLPKEISNVADNFTLPHEREKRKQLEAKIRAAIANPLNHKTVLVDYLDKNYAVLIITKINDSGRSIEILRHNGDLISKTIAQDYAWKEIFSELNEGLNVLTFSDKKSLNHNKSLLKNTGLVEHNSSWKRLAIKGIFSIDQLTQVLKEEGLTDDLKHTLKYEEASPSKIEETYWPLKLSDADIPTYLIPIRPTWALNMFDDKLAERDLLGANPTKIFNIENVYYRKATRPNYIEPGSRILWYVSSEKGKDVSQIRATSRLLSCENGTAKELFKKYKRLGVYEWQDLMRISNNDPHGGIMALHFYQTECFKTPINLEDFKSYGINGQPFGPRLVSNNDYINIYQSANND